MKVSEWLAANRLSLNVEKSKLLYFSLIKTISKPNLSINNETSKESKVAKYLGVLIDNKLQWHDQINAINIKMSKGIGMLAKIRHYVPRSVLRSIYFSFIHSHIEYNLLYWGKYAKTTITVLISTLKKLFELFLLNLKMNRLHPYLKN